MGLRSHLRIGLAVLLVALLAAVPVLAAEVQTGQSIRSTEGVVTAAHPLAAQAGAEILAKGGNAVDAAIATAYALAVVEPYASNLGGEGYMVISLTDGTETAIDYRSRAPLHVHVHKPAEIGWPPHGIYTTMVPGMVKGTEKALLQYGTMTLAEVLEPAIRLAEGGFEVTPLLAQQIANAYDSFLMTYPEAGRVFLDDGLVPEAGTIMRNPDLARALRLIAEHGSDVFYHGEIAEAIEQATDGWIDRESLAAYEAIERDVVRGSYRGYEIISAPPIVAGVRVIETLNILENFDLSAYGSINHPMVAHIIAEALKLSGADYNAYVWDPNFFRVPVEGLVSKQYARQRAALISLERAQDFSAGDPFALLPEIDGLSAADPYESPSTTHISVLDKDGNAVSLTQTISSFWGSRIVVPGYGFILSNHFRQFPGFDASDPYRPDYAAPLKSTRTVLSPTIMKKDGRVRLVVGTPGAGRIPQSTVQTIVSLIDFGMDVESAIRAPKLHVSGLTLDLEGGFPDEAVAALEALGHDVRLREPLDLYFGGLNVVMVEDDGTMVGVGSFRRSGGASAPVSEEAAVVH
ncbi:MAG: gamma-glutamyltransferase [Firmicutes bacterium]|nr:gamma-glutamyltransferase [Bacillota bacterium]